MDEVNELNESGKIGIGFPDPYPYDVVDKEGFEKYKGWKFRVQHGNTFYYNVDDPFKFNPIGDFDTIVSFSSGHCDRNGIEIFDGDWVSNFAQRDKHGRPYAAEVHVKPHIDQNGNLSKEITFDYEDSEAPFHSKIKDDSEYNDFEVHPPENDIRHETFIKIRSEKQMKQ